jgi:hypothetical protein
MKTVTLKQTERNSIYVSSSGIIRRDSNTWQNHYHLMITLENQHRNTPINLPHKKFKISTIIIHLVKVLKLDTQEVEKILLYSHSRDLSIISVWRLLNLGILKLNSMISNVCASQLFFTQKGVLKKIPTTSHSGSGKQPPQWVVVSQKMPTKLPSLFVNIHQEVILCQATLDT